MKKTNQLLMSMHHLIEKYKYFIFDCDGVLWKSHKYFPQSIEFVNTLCSMPEKRVFFLTNSSQLSRNDIHLKIMKGNFSSKIQAEDVYTSSSIVSQYINETYPEINYLYCIGRKGLSDELQALNIKTAGGPLDDDKYGLDLNTIDSLVPDPNIQGVVCGWDYLVNFYKITYALRIIHNSNKLFLGTNIDANSNSLEGIKPGAYTFIGMLQSCSGREAEIITKPKQI